MCHVTPPPSVPQDFEWSPAEPLLAAYTQEVGDRPASISIVKIPDRSAVRSKQLFNVSGECSL
jgi:translation initiation factor 3 subunit B